MKIRAPIYLIGALKLTQRQEADNLGFTILKLEDKFSKNLRFRNMFERNENVTEYAWEYVEELLVCMLSLFSSTFYGVLQNFGCAQS